MTSSCAGRSSARSVEQGAHPGATRRRDAEQSRSDILAAACVELAVHGIESARVDRIARRAGVDKRLAYYYFGDRRALLAAAVDRQKCLMHGEFSALDLDALAPKEALRGILELLWNQFEANPHMSLAVWEGASEGDARTAQIGLLEVLDRAIRRGIGEGVFLASVNVGQLAVSAISLAHYFSKNIEPLSVVIGEDLAQPHARRRRFSNVVALIFMSILRDPTERPPLTSRAPRA